MENIVESQNLQFHVNKLLDYGDASPRDVDDWESSFSTDRFWNKDIIYSTPSAKVALSFRLITYNIHGWRDTDHLDNFDRIVSLLSRLDADVIALQEVLHPYNPPSDPLERAAYFQRVKCGKGNGFESSHAPDSNGEGTPYLYALARALGMNHTCFGQATSDGYFGRFGYGNAVLSRFPILRESHLVVQASPEHQIGRRIEAEDRCFTAVTLGLQPPAQSGVNAGDSDTVDADGGELVTVCVTHLDQLSDELRLEQVRAILARTAELGRHVLCGDLNVFQRADAPENRWAAIEADAAAKGWPSPPERSAALDAVREAGYQDCFYLSDNHRLGVFHDGRSVSAAAATWAKDATDQAGCGGKWQAGVEGVLTRDAEHPGPTCWVTKPLLRIDYAFLSPGRLLPAAPADNVGSTGGSDKEEGGWTGRGGGSSATSGSSSPLSSSLSPPPPPPPLLSSASSAPLSPCSAASPSPCPSSPLSAATLAGRPAAGAGAAWAWVRQYQRVEDDASDHFPVVVDLAVPAPRPVPPPAHEAARWVS